MTVSLAGCRVTAQMLGVLSVVCVCEFALPAQSDAPTARMLNAGPSGPLPLVARGTLRWAANLRPAPTVDTSALTLLPTGAVLTVDAWATDASGTAWYHGSTTDGTGWVYGDAVTLDAGRATAPATLLAPFQGMGVWLTYDVLQRTPVSVIVETALRAGLTHLYVEVAASSRGFYGRSGLAALLPAAHRAGLHVLAWVYPYLLDLPHDIALSVAAATYVAPGGDRLDGLLADVEENMAEGAVRAYGQIVRALLGPNEPMAIATYPPQHRYGLTYPFATAALSWNVIVPMDYWHLELRPYSAAEVHQFVYDSVRLIRARTSAAEPVEVLAQLFSPDPSSADGPTAAELKASATAAHDAGALGVSFYDWSHATTDDWHILAALQSTVGPPATPLEPFALTTVPVLNLRAAPALGAPIIEQLARGTRLTFRGYHNSWAAVVAPDGRSGYVYRYYLSAVRGKRSPYIVVAVPVANVRAGPSVQASILAQEPQGTRLALQAVSGAWARIALPSGVTGWILRTLTTDAVA